MRKILAYSFLAIWLLVACGTTAPPVTPTSVGASAPRGRLVVAQTVDAQSMDPYQVNQVAGESVMKALFDHLIERDFDGNLVPGLAESWKVVDEKTIEFRLRQGVNFHNGEPFTAEAVKYSVERIQNADLKSAFRSNFKAIQEVRIVDPQTVRFILDKTDAAILDNLSAQLAIVPPKYIQAVGDAEFARKPVGSGPFKFVEWVKDDHITLEANANYWSGSFKGKPQVQTVVFRPVPESSTRIAELRTGRADLIQDVPPDQVKDVKDAGFGIAVKDVPQEAFIFLASDAPGTPLADKRVRQALNYGVNVDGIIQNVLLGYARRIASPIGPLSLGYDSGVKPYLYDLVKAKALLAEAGYTNGFDVVIDATTSDKTLTTEAVAGELGKLNVRATVRRLELGIFNDNWGKKLSSPMVAARWSVIAEGAATLDQTKRAQIYAQLSKVLNEDPLAIYLWNTQNLYGVGKRVAGWRPHPRSYLVVSGVSVSEN
ncbi:MAG: hypothetical protein HY259_09850 [Chloroflexi bacterium]|nr:hypothetical protein [Chloroflexota bacterium]